MFSSSDGTPCFGLILKMTKHGGHLVNFNLAHKCTYPAVLHFWWFFLKHFSVALVFRDAVPGSQWDMVT